MKINVIFIHYCADAFRPSQALFCTLSGVNWTLMTILDTYFAPATRLRTKFEAWPARSTLASNDPIGAYLWWCWQCFHSKRHLQSADELFLYHFHHPHFLRVMFRVTFPIHSLHTRASPPLLPVQWGRHPTHASQTSTLARWQSIGVSLDTFVLEQFPLDLQVLFLPYISFRQHFRHNYLWFLRIVDNNFLRCTIREEAHHSYDCFRWLWLWFL